MLTYSLLLYRNYCVSFLRGPVPGVTAMPCPPIALIPSPGCENPLSVSTSYNFVPLFAHLSAGGVALTSITFAYVLFLHNEHINFHVVLLNRHWKYE